MKKLLFLFFTLTVFSCDKYVKTAPKPLPTPDGFGAINTPILDCNGNTVRWVQQLYKLNEVIVTYAEGTAPADVVAYHAYMISKGFSLFQACACTIGSELWRGPENVQGITSGSGAKGGSAEGIGGETYLSRNFVLQFDPIASQDGQISDSIKIQAPNSTSVKVAIVDSGVDSTISNLKKALTKNPTSLSYCIDIPEGKYGINMLDMGLSSRNPESLDINGHGTFVNGIVARPMPLETGGGANTVSIINAKFIRNNSNTSGLLFDALCGVFYALDKKARVINISWRMKIDKAPEGFITVLQRVKKDRVLIVAGAGNDTLDIDNAMRSWPASFTSDPFWGDNVISVGAWNKATNQVAVFSNFGDNNVDVFAPGVDINSFLIGGRVGKANGTSFAAPHITRAAAILRGRFPSYSPLQIKNLIKTNSSVITTTVGGISGRSVKQFDPTTENVATW